jgi:hypothetical protein
MAGIPDLAMNQIERWCKQQVPTELQDKLRVECHRRGATVTIVARRPPWRPKSGLEWSERKIAQLRLVDTGRWSVRWADRNGRWLSDPDTPEADTPLPLLDEIGRNLHNAL